MKEITWTTAKQAFSLEVGCDGQIKSRGKGDNRNIADSRSTKHD